MRERAKERERERASERAKEREREEERASESESERKRGRERGWERERLGESNTSAPARIGPVLSAEFSVSTLKEMCLNFEIFLGYNIRQSEEILEHLVIQISLRQGYLSDSLRK